MTYAGNYPNPIATLPVGTPAEIKQEVGAPNTLCKLSWPNTVAGQHKGVLERSTSVSLNPLDCSMLKELLTA